MWLGFSTFGCDEGNTLDIKPPASRMFKTGFNTLEFIIKYLTRVFPVMKPKLMIAKLACRRSLAIIADASRHVRTSSVY